MLRGDGYARALIDGEMHQLSDEIKLTKQKKHTIEVVIDRLVIRDGIRQRLTDSIETALRLAKGIVVADFVDLARTATSWNSTRSNRVRSRSTPRTAPARSAPASATV